MSDKRSMASEIVDKVLESNAILFVDQYNNPYIAFDGNGNSVSEINHTICRQYITNLSYDTLDHIPSTTIENQVIKVLEAKARRSGNRHDLDISIVRYRNTILYDMGNGAIRITDKKWGAIKNPPIVFRKPANQKQQLKPKRGGDLRTLLGFLNITNESEQLLFLCYVVTAFIPDIQHPILILYGMQGAGKTTPMQILKSLTDHSEADSGFNQPKDEQDLALHAYHNYLLFYDNMSTIGERQSDAFAKAVTGSAFTTRKLYTNNEMFTYKFRRAIIFNGLNQMVAKSDLLDRSLAMQLERITPDKRKEPGVFWAEFEAAKPEILGAIFDTLVKAIAVYPKIESQQWSRMADFDHWGCAIAEALDYGQDKFMQARSQNMQLQHDNAIEANAVGQAIVEFMQDKTYWADTASQLYGLLEPIFDRLHLEKPKTAPRLSREITPLIPNLQAQGINVKRGYRGKERIFTFTKTTVGTDGTDSKNG